MGSLDNFDALRKLLGLKRYEQPPPRYFETFSSRVMARIEAGEVRLSWWEKFGFDLRPALAAVMGMMACGLVVYGVATAGGDEEQMNAAASVVSAPGWSQAFSQQENPLLSRVELAGANSTNPVITYGTPIDRALFRGGVLPVNHQAP